MLFRKSIPVAQEKPYPQKLAVLPGLVPPATSPGSQMQMSGARHTLSSVQYLSLRILPCARNLLRQYPVLPPPAATLVNPVFPRLFQHARSRAQAQRDKCAKLFLNVTWLRLNQKGGPPAKPGVPGVPRDPAALEKFGCRYFFSAGPGSFPRRLGFFS